MSYLDLWTFTQSWVGEPTPIEFWPQIDCDTDVADQYVPFTVFDSGETHEPQVKIECTQLFILILVDSRLSWSNYVDEQASEHTKEPWLFRL